jgi:hypothetical protein
MNPVKDSYSEARVAADASMADDSLAPLRVELTVHRAGAILVSLVPVLLLLGSLPGSSNFGSGSVVIQVCSLNCSHNGGKHQDSPAGNSLQSVQRATRRVNIQPRADDFGEPALVAQFPIGLPRQSFDFFVPRAAAIDLANCWQFLWRTALPPRAPSAVS